MRDANTEMETKATLRRRVSRLAFRIPDHHLHERSSNEFTSIIGFRTHAGSRAAHVSHGAGARADRQGSHDYPWRGDVLMRGDGA